MQTIPHTFNQKGFAAIEAILILVVIAIAGGTGYYVWHTKQQTNKTFNVTGNASSNRPKTTSPPGTKVSVKDGTRIIETFTMPTGWKVSDMSPSGSIGDGCSVNALNDLKAVSSGEVYTLVSTKNTSDNVSLDYDIVKQPDTKSLADYFANDIGATGTKHADKNYKVNGNSAYFYQATGGGEGASEASAGSYKQETYLVSHNGYVACFSWRPVDQTSSPGYDHAQFTADVKGIVNSTKFTD